nr:A-agglutinin anchorage subunit-like [Quercus suber]POE50702.1 hypothetical protein CFP56_16217 [Quercus suber]
MRPTQLFTSALLIVAASSASSPFPPNTMLEARQDDATTTSSSSFILDFSGVQGNTATTVVSSSETSSGTDDASSATATDTDSNSNSQSDSASTSGSQGNSTQTSDASSQATTKTYDARLPAGGVSLITPAAIATSYYKIKDNIVFAWNYTSLSATPNAVDVLASCAQNSEIYTISANMSITNDMQAVTWDTGAYQATASPQLFTSEYTLIIHDATKDISAVAQAGYLGTFNSFRFGMYLPRPYNDLQEFKCVTCNGANTLMDKNTMSLMCGMTALTILSFSWFGGIAGVW